MDSDTNPVKNTATKFTNEKLRLNVYIRTVGKWKPTLEALSRFDAVNRALLLSKVKAIMNGLADKSTDVWPYRPVWPWQRQTNYEDILCHLLRDELPTAINALTSDQFSDALDVAQLLLESGINPISYLEYGLPAAAKALSAEQFLAGLNLARHLSEHGINPSHTLQAGLPATVEALTAEQLLVGLDLARRLCENGIDPSDTMQYVLPSIVKINPSLEEFQTNLLALEKLIICLHSLQWYNSGMVIREFLNALKALTTERFLAALDLPRRLCENGIHPYATVNYGLPAAAQALTAEQFFAALELAIRLSENGICPSDTLRYGIPTIAKVGCDPETFQANLLPLERLVICLHSSKIDPSDTLQYGLPAIVQIDPTPEAFQANLHALERLVIRLNKLPRNILNNFTSKDFFKLTQLAIVLYRQYEDFEAIQHDAVVHNEDDEENAYGVMQIKTIIDYPSWVELRPTGPRKTEFSLTATEENDLETMLAERSWMWRYRFANDDVTRARFRHRIAELRPIIPTLLDRLIRQGVLEATAHLMSVYLLGSYPWAKKPNDIDLVIIVQGQHDVTSVGPNRLTRMGVQTDELPLPLEIDIVGHETLLQAYRGEPIPNAEPLAIRYAFLYGSVLLAGADLFEDAPIRLEALENILDRLCDDRIKASWPNLKEDRNKIAEKTQWRQTEEKALIRFICESVELNQQTTEFLSRFEDTKVAAIITALTKPLEGGFTRVALTTVTGGEATALKEFQDRFGTSFADATSRLTSICMKPLSNSPNSQDAIERTRQHSAFIILASGSGAGTGTGFLQTLESTTDNALMETVTRGLVDGFRQVATSASTGHEEAVLEAFQTRFGVAYRYAKDRLTRLSNERSEEQLQRLRRESARKILVACPITLKIETLVQAAGPAGADTLLRPAAPTNSDATNLLRPGSSPDDQNEMDQSKSKH